MRTEREFDKYRKRGKMHWESMKTLDIRKFNAFQQARYDWILKLLGDINGRKVLDVGTGDGAFAYLMAKKRAKVTGIDNSAMGIQFARENVEEEKKKESWLECEFKEASAYELPFPDNSFDAVVACEIIEHVDHPERLLSEAARVLRPDGVAIITTPHRLTKVPSDPNHVTEYFPEDMNEMMSKQFAKTEIKQTHHILWYALYTYSFRHFKNRPFFKWLINLLAIYLRWNPFMIDYPRPTKFDRFTTIMAKGVKDEYYEDSISTR